MVKEAFEVTMENGEIEKAELLFSFESSGDNFIMYAIKGAAYGAKLNKDGKLSKVYDDEWKLLEKMFNEYMEHKDGDK